MLYRSGISQNLGELKSSIKPSYTNPIPKFPNAQGIEHPLDLQHIEKNSVLAVQSDIIPNERKQIHELPAGQEGARVRIDRFRKLHRLYPQSAGY